ncbi:clustered mitochondria protein [Spatholobus suberectus]|nr:clustered mitochondria protein [Spatholobus suberectus]
MDPPPLSATVTTTTTQKNHPDSVESSSPRSRNAETWNDEALPVVPGAKLRLMCSYGGHIMPRPHDKSLCYVGGDTRIVVVDRHSSLKDLCARLSRTILNGRPFTLKYQLPNEELDSLITVTTDEDLDNMVEEYDRITAKGSASSRLRVFLFFTKPEATVSMGSLLDDAKSETWFVDALNNSGMISRVVSDSAAGDCFVNLDGVGAGGSSNNLEALPDANNNNKVKNLPDVVQVQSTPGSPMLENNSSSSPSFSPSVDNLPPIRVRVDDNGSRLQQENKVGVVVEEEFAQMTIASGVKPDDGLVNVVSSAVAVPAIPASVTMASVGVVTTSDNVMNRVVSEDERLDHGFRKPPLPLQLMQPKTSGGLGLASPDSVASDSSIASANSFSKTIYYQDQVQAGLLDSKVVCLPNAKSEISDQVPGLQREQVQDSGYMLPPQLDQNKQLQQQKPLVHASTHYIHLPAAATGQVPVSSYYHPVYAPSPQQLHHPIGQQQYPVYVMPVGPTQPYNMALQPNIADPNVVASGRPLMPQSAVPSAAYKDGTPPIYPTRSATPTIPEVTPSVYKAPPVASNPTYAPIPPNQFQPQYVGLPQFHHPPQSIAVAPSSTTTNYGYEYGGHVQDQAYYTQQQQTTTAPLLPQYQSMTPAAAAAALSDASKQFPAENIQQSNRASQPV